MKLHANHRTCPSSRRLMCRRVLEEGWTLRQAAEAAGCSIRTAAKWLSRYRAGDRQLLDRSSRPRRSPTRVPQQRLLAIERLRRVRMTAAEIAEVLDLPLSTVSLWLKRIGLGKRSRLDPLEPPNRYERRHPGELIHIDIKKLGRISALGAGHRVTGVRSSEHARTRGGRKVHLTGYEYLHVVIDDYSRLAYAEVLDDLTAACAVAFLRRAVAWYAARGVTVKAVMTDNGACFIAHDYQRAVRALGLKQLRIRPGRPRTNGKAERLIQTLLNEWAYARIYGSSTERTATLPLYLDRYNYRRPHGSLSHQPPASRLNNVLGNYN
ncbi:MAG: IS481 family transposase [Actinobacteria bacterium]|nr:MAG: IS481 family transposase [Actinomycetota bacterium]